MDDSLCSSHSSDAEFDMGKDADIQTDITKQDARNCALSLPYCLPVHFGFDVVDEKDKHCICPCNDKLRPWWSSRKFPQNLTTNIKCDSAATSPSGLVMHAKRYSNSCILHFILYTYLSELYMDQGHVRKCIGEDRPVGYRVCVLGPVKIFSPLDAIPCQISLSVGITKVTIKSSPPSPPISSSPPPSLVKGSELSSKILGRPNLYMDDEEHERI